MSEISDRYATVADGFRRRLWGVDRDRLSSPSPCTEWSAADVVDHVIMTHRRVLGTLRGDQVVELAADDDRRRCWSEASRDVSASLDDPDEASRTISGMFGEQSFESLVSRLLCADTLIHTWDLARATGQDERLDPSAVERAMDFLGPIDEAIRRPGGFAPKIDPPAGADAQTRLLNFAGRTM